MSTSKTKSFRNFLIEKRKKLCQPLEKQVCSWLLSNSTGYEKAENYAQEVLEHGCISGHVNQLIYTADTDRFFTKHSKQIILLYGDECEEIGEAILFHGKVDNFTPNNFAWFAFETWTRKFLDEWESEND